MAMYTITDRKVVNLAHRQQAPRGSYENALWQQRCQQAGPVRPVVGFLHIALCIENWPGTRCGFFVPDVFPLNTVEEAGPWPVGVGPDFRSPDGWLHVSLAEQRRRGRTIAPAIFSPRAVDDPECIAVMERLGRAGLETSQAIVEISDASMLRFFDGKPRPPRRAPRKELLRSTHQWRS